VRGQITDGFLAVKKEPDGSTCLQDCLSLGKAPTPLRRPLGSSSYGASPEPHAELFSHLSSPLPPLPGNLGHSASNANTLSSLIRADGVVSGQDRKGTRQEVVFRMLCSGHAAGCVIGKKGTVVRALQNEAGASISFSSPLTESRDRVVTISAWEVRCAIVICRSSTINSDTSGVVFVEIFYICFFLKKFFLDHKLMHTLTVPYIVFIIDLGLT
jgi:hypothetical protein